MRWITCIEGGPKRVNHAAVAVNHKIYSFGGYCTGEESSKYESMDVHVLNTTTNRWIRHPVSDIPYFENDDICPFKRYGHTAVVYKNNVYIWGGRNNIASCAVLFCFNTKWHCWTAPVTTGSIPLARDGHSACVWKNYMVIFGGYEEESNSFTDSMYYLNLDSMHWSYVPSRGVSPVVRDFHTTVVIKDKMYLFGGRAPDNIPNMGNMNDEYPNDIWYFDLNNLNWVKIKATAEIGHFPKGRRSHSAFVYEEKMYIFGGYNYSLREHLNDLLEFNVSKNSWRKLDIQGTSPCKRRRQACISVQDRVFLFGGTSPKTHEISEQEDYLGFDESLKDHGDMFILDMKPTLKTLAMIVVRKHNLDESQLPQNLKIELANHFTPNKVSLSRQNNSSG